MAVQPAPQFARYAGTAPTLALYHRGFALTVRCVPGRFGAASYGFALAHQGLLLHTSTADFRTAPSADRAARRFVDDALASFDHAVASCAFDEEPD